MSTTAMPQIVIFFMGGAAQEQPRLLRIVQELYERGWLAALDPSEGTLVNELVARGLPFVTFGSSHEEESGHLGPSHVPTGEYDPVEHIVGLGRLISRVGAGVVQTDGNTGCHGHWLSVYLSVARKPSVRIQPDDTLAGLEPKGWASVKADRKIRREMDIGDVTNFLLGIAP